MTHTAPEQARTERADFIHLLLWEWLLPVLGFWVALLLSTQISRGGHTDAPAVFPYQFHVAAALLVPLVNGWVFLPRFRRRTQVVLAGLATPVAVLVLLAVL